VWYRQGARPSDAPGWLREVNAVKITFLGAVQTVTGSMHLLEINGHRLLLDCGLFQGHREEAMDRNRHLPFDAKSVEALILSHAHIDHSGNIPSLVRSGFDGNILCTSATRDLCALMLRDSAHIQVSDAEHMTKQNARKGLPPVEPLYTVDDADAALKLFVGLSYDRPFAPVPGVSAVLRDAGHILGAAITVLEITESGRTVRLGFTGDLGRRNLPILRDPTLVTDIDYLITESTYGNRLHGDITHVEEDLRRIITDTAARGGKLLIPAFAVERTQEIVYTIHRLVDAGRMPAIPVYVDSPLALDATEVFRLHPELFDDEVRGFLDLREDPFGFRQLTYVRSVDDSKALNALRGPAVIIAASGMCEAGRILHHLANNIENPRNTVLLVSYQAENTLGRHLADGDAKVHIFGEEYTRRARVEVMDAFSAHADRADLLWWIGAASANLKGVFVVHGDPEASAALADSVIALGVPGVHVPERGETVSI
jgi:metallo-beta-lactamase family protein